MKPYLLFVLITTTLAAPAWAQSDKGQIPADFVRNYYRAYGGRPTSEKLAPFYADDVRLEDPTYSFVGENKQAIFANFDSANRYNHYDWQVSQVITQGNVLVTEGLLKARYDDLPYEMRFVNIFHFRDGKIIRQYDYYDNKDYFKVVEEWKKRQSKQ